MLLTVDCFDRGTVRARGTYARTEPIKSMIALTRGCLSITSTFSFPTFLTPLSLHHFHCIPHTPRPLSLTHPALSHSHTLPSPTHTPCPVPLTHPALSNSHTLPCPTHTPRPLSLTHPALSHSHTPPRPTQTDPPRRPFGPRPSPSPRTLKP